jgi:primosomal protein N'
VAEPREVVGREQELEVVRAFAAGDGFATLVLEGEAGIGKTTLLREAVAAASGAGAGVLMAWPAAAEAALAFSGLGDLLAGALDEIVSELRRSRGRSTLPCFAERPASGRWIRTPSRRGS